jgi:hypothetical protein
VMFGPNPTLLVVYIAILLSTSLVGFGGSWMIYHKKFQSPFQNTAAVHINKGMGFSVTKTFMCYGDAA